MQNQVIIRSKRDRLRYTCLFELCLLLILAPAGAMFFERDLTDIGQLSLILSIKAMLMNYLYNWAFDSYDAKAGRVSSDRSWAGRLLHALGFECVLVLTSLPLLMWWLELSMGQAFLMDLLISAFVVVFNLGFTWVYDWLFPVQQSGLAAE